MRDIRGDLEERLEALRRERAHLELQISTLEQKESVLRALLKQEDERLASHSVLPIHPSHGLNGDSRYSSPVAKSVLASLQEHSLCSLEELKEEAMRRSVPFGKKNPGRVIHFLLLGMQQNGIVERLKDGSWRLGTSTGVSNQ
jgi:hypothetical protein